MIKHLLFGGGGGGTRTADIGLLLLRLFAGLTMALAHGMMKLQNPSMIIGGVEKMGLPLPTVAGWAAIFAEFGGGLLVAIGLATRPAAFLMAFTMSVAAFVAHRSDPFQVKEMALLYLAISVCLMLTGSGRYGVDALLAPKGAAARGFPVS